MYSHVKWSNDDINIMLTMLNQKKSFAEIARVINRSPLSVKYKFGRIYRKNKRVPITIFENKRVMSSEYAKGGGGEECEEDEEDEECDECDKCEGEDEDEEEEDEDEEEEEEEEEDEDEEEDDEDEEEEDEEDEDEGEDTCRYRKKRKCTKCDCDSYCECINGFSVQPHVYYTTYNGLDNTSFVLTLCTGSLLGITFCLGLNMYIKILTESLNTLAVKLI